jgi:hypothetical protein
MGAQLLHGSLPDWLRPGSGDGSGYGDGSGDGSGSGYGDGSGDGSGYGYGDGYGDGSGDGSGYGYGDGSGYGYGDGYGDGSGDGSGYGYGDGSGYGYGYGDGYGSGDGSGYWCHRFKEFLDLPRVRELLNTPNVSFGYWRSDKNGKPANGGHSTESARPGLVQQINGPLNICTSRALHATLDPGKWEGDRLWLVDLFGEVQTSDDKLGALKREIIAEVTI